MSIVPTRGQFKKATGRSMWYSNIIKTNDQLINNLINLLGDYKTVKDTGTHREEVVLRKIRRTAIGWIMVNPDDKPRQSRGAVVDLTHRVNIRLDDIAQSLHGAPSPSERLRRAAGRTVVPGSPGKNVGEDYKTEWKDLHWGVKQNQYKSGSTSVLLRKFYDQAKTKMPFDRWVQFVFLPRIEDDPKGVFFGGVYAPGQLFKYQKSREIATGMRTNMVRMLNARERRDFVIHFRGGMVYGPTGTLLDTGSFKSVHRVDEVGEGKGIGIYVISPANTWYAGGHVKNHFHHSSFLAGSRVLAAGEISVVRGRLSLLTNKTGHYQAGADEMLHALELLQAGGVRLNSFDVQIRTGTATGPRTKADDWYAKNSQLAA